jgi:hypothetical protein
VTAILALLVAGPAGAKVFLTRERAMELAFGPDAGVERDVAYLSEAEVERARAIAGAGVDVRSAMVTRYVARRDGAVVGTAYLDTHRVRTLEETLMIVVAPDGSVGRIDVLTFGEPQEYLPKALWFEQFTGRRLDDELAIKRAIRGITGATLSSHGATEAVRRTLAIHGVLSERPGP